MQSEVRVCKRSIAKRRAFLLLRLKRSTCSTSSNADSMMRTAAAWVCDVSLGNHEKWLVSVKSNHAIYCRASHTGDACRGRGRERERGISSELADMTCCELHLRCRHRHCRRRRCCRRRCCCCFWSSFSFSFLFLFVLSLSLSLLFVVVVIVVVVVVVVVFVVVVFVVVVFVVVVGVVVVVVVVVIVVIAVAAWSCYRCRCYLCSWYFLQTPQNRQIDGFCKPPKSAK